MSTMWRLSNRFRVPLAALCSAPVGRFVSNCEEAPQTVEPNVVQTKVPGGTTSAAVAGMKADAEGDYNGLFPMRQLWQPKVQYPLWDKNWDGKQMPTTGDPKQDRANARHIRKTGVTRHIILIRHGQYDETYKEDEKRVLTPLGREQAELTGKRLAEMIKGAEKEFGPCNIKAVRVSNMTRAKETGMCALLCLESKILNLPEAQIIAAQIPSVPLTEPDPNLNEGRPSHHIPGGAASDVQVSTVDENHPRIEESFKKLFFRADAPPLEGEDDSEVPPVEERHEFEIVVCHANVIRYFLMRALQLPPEAWLRLCPFNCSLTYVTIRATGSVSCRMMGDIGHLPYDHSTFSMHHGYNW